MSSAERFSVPASLGPIALIVEDDPDVRRTALAIMDEFEVNAAEASSGEDALAYLREHAPDVGLIFTDLELAGRLDGIDVARVVSLRWPWIKVLITSGGARISDVPANVVFLPKPWHAADIWAHIQWETARAQATGQEGDRGIAHWR